MELHFITLLTVSYISFSFSLNRYEKYIPQLLYLSRRTLSTWIFQDWGLGFNKSLSPKQVYDWLLLVFLYVDLRDVGLEE